MRDKLSNCNCKGFTLAELLIGLMVMSIVLSAVATLSFALGSANDSVADTTEKQAHVRYAMLRISELIRHCKLICRATPGTMAIWRADDNGDGQINPGELVYLIVGTEKNFIKLLEFSPPALIEDNIIPIAGIQAGVVRQNLIDELIQLKDQ